jgi:uncharacterized protein (DUF2147 family)
MQFFTRFVAGRRGNLAAQAAFALGAALVLPELRDAQAAGQAAGPAEVGVWINHEGKGAVEIKPCGAALCGNIVWLKNPVNDQGQPLFDRRNPDETKRTRPICGLAVIGNVKRTSGGWDEGWIYNPEEGAQFDVALQASGDRLTVTGYKGIKLFSKTLIWTRAPADLQRCDGAAPQQTKAKPIVAPPKLAAPKPQDGTSAPAAKKPVTATTAPAGAKPAAKSGTVTNDTKKLPVAKDAKATTAAKQPASTAAPAKKAAAPTAGTSKKAAIENPAKPSGTPSTKTAAPAVKAAAKPAAGTAKAAAGAPVPPAPTAAKKPVAKKPATATASTAGDKKATVPTDKGAAKPAAKKKTADEDDASSTVE